MSKSETFTFTHTVILAIAALLIIYSVESRANPGNSSGAGRTVESGTSGKISREKSMSQDKSSGNKSSSSSSKESSREKSKETKTSKSKKQEESQKLDMSVKLNANPLFISEFINVFERRELDNPDNRDDMADLKRPELFFASCRPFTGMDAQFPVLSHAAGRAALRGHFVIVQKNFASRMGGGWTYDNSIDGIPQPPTAENLDKGPLTFYIVCRQAAHFVMSQTAESLEELIRIGRFKPKNEGQLRLAIRIGYETYINTPDYWNFILQQVFTTPKNRVKKCAPFLHYAKNARDHNMDCGNFKVQGDTVYIDGMPTMSAEAINGRKFEIAFSDSDNMSVADAEDASESSKASTSSKSSSSRESYADTKKTTGMKASKSGESSSSSKTSRDSKADVQASPQQ